MLVDFENIGQNISMHKYSLIGSGTGRLVYDLDNGYVAKVAKNKKGIAQNKAEYQISTMDDTDLFAEVLAMSDNCRFLIMVRAERIGSMTVVWKYYNVNNNHELFHLDNFRDFYKKYNLLFGDLCRRSSWGIVNERPVIIDYGFTKEARRYYNTFF